jgi:hypothetical protein
MMNERRRERKRRTEEQKYRLKIRWIDEKTERMRSAGGAREGWLVPNLTA